MLKDFIRVIVCFALLLTSVWATTDTLEGEGLTSSATIEGVATTDTIEGQVLVSGCSNNCTGTLLCQNLEAVGYDNSESWSETTTGAGTINENFSNTGAMLGDNWCDQSVEISVTATDTAYIELQPAGPPGDVWGRVEVVLTAESLANTERAEISRGIDAGWAVAWILTWHQDAGGDLYLEMQSNHDGDPHWYDSLAILSLNTKYRVEMKWDSSNNLWGWKIDGVVQTTDQGQTDGLLTDTHPTDITRFRVGAPTGAENAWTYNADRIVLDDDTWIGAD